MSQVEGSDQHDSLPADWIAVPLSPSHAVAAAVRLSVIIRKQEDPTHGYLVTVRRTFNARVVLACITDAANRITRWLELWIQQTPEITGLNQGDRFSLSNNVLDQRWHRQAEARRIADEAGTIVTGWETSNPVPTWIDRSTHTVYEGIDADSGKPLELCRNDSLLIEHGLPPFSTTCYRYLYVPEHDQPTLFVPLTAGAPARDSTRVIEQVIGSQWKNLVPLNSGCGLLMVQAYSPIELEKFSDVLAGQKYVDVRSGVASLGLQGVLEPSSAKPSHHEDGDGRLFLERHGQWGRLLESYHLKIKMLADAVTAVQKVVQHTQAPLLNLKPSSFGLRFGAKGCGLPHLWTATLALVDGGDAVSLSMDADAGEYFQRVDGDAVSIYQPRSAGVPSQGVATVRIRNVETPTDDSLIVEGTLATDERLETQPGDLVWLVLAIAGQTIHLAVRLEREQALAKGEWRFTATNQPLTADQVECLTAAKGVPIPEVCFEVIPHRSTPCDLYALAVMGVRILCVNQAASLPETLDEVLSLARQLAKEYNPEVPLEQRIMTVFSRDPRWLDSLGPHRLLSQPIAAEDAFDAIPPKLWWQTLALIIKMLPVMGPDSISRGWGDASPGQIHRVFDQTALKLKALMLQSWSLIVVDWKFNREVHSVIHECLGELCSQPE